MGFTLRFILGSILVLLICCPSVHPSRTRLQRQTNVKLSSDNSTTTKNDITEKIIESIENVELKKLVDKTVSQKSKESETKPKTDTDVKNVDSKILFDKKLKSTDKQQGNGSIKLQVSKPYIRNETETVGSKETIDNVVVKQNNTDSSDPNRKDKARSIDVDIDKYVSPDFHNINNVYTLPISPDTEKYIDPNYQYHSSTHKDDPKYDFSSELTTPKTDFFDSKYKETVESLGQSLDFKESQIEESSKEQLDVTKLIDQTKNDNINANLDYTKLKNIETNESEKKNSLHKDLSVEEATKLNFESFYNDTKVIDDKPDEQNNIVKEQVPVKGDQAKSETSTSKNNFIVTTRKSITLTKPPSNRNNSYIINNNIETETIKAAKGTTTEKPRGETETANKLTTKLSPVDVTKRGSVKFADYTTPVITTVKPIRNKSNYQKKLNKTSEQVVQENQIIPVHVSAPGNLVETTTAKLNKETNKSKVIITTEPTNLETTSRVDVGTTELSAAPTTTTVAAVDDATDKPTTTNVDLVETTTSYDDATTIFYVAETSTVGVSPSSEDTTTFLPTTTELHDDSTTINDVESTTMTTIKPLAELILTTEEMSAVTSFKDVRHVVTDSAMRTSKGMVFETITPTYSSIFEITTIPSKIIQENTTNTEAETTTENLQTTTDFIPTTVPPYIEDIKNITESNITKTPENISTKVTTTLEPFTESTEDLDENTTNKPQTTTEIVFVHIENVDNNHTTLLPETIKPSYNYPTPEIVEPNKNRNLHATNASTSSTTSVTEEDGSTETPTENGLVEDPSDNKGTIAAIVISSVGAVCLILLAGLLYVMRRRQKKFNYGQRCTPVSLDDYSMDNMSVYNSVSRRKGAMRASKRSYGNPAFDDPTGVSHPLNFPALAKFSTNFEDIKAEYDEIPQITARVSELPEGCEFKNRYANVIPLPETRVFLNVIDSYPNSDYINANYVTGPKDTKGYYIACQGPMQNTVDDFWRMVWEQQTKVILMATHLFENGIEKCVDYLPPSEVLDCHRLFGDFQVTLKGREVKEKYIISSLQLKNMVSNCWREVTHFWYLGWPEKGVPSEANSLIAFLIEARSCMKSSTAEKNNSRDNGSSSTANGSANSDVSPVVVHCSPGTGRTGVVIACDIAIREFEQTRLVDIPKIVYRIRRDRASSVQTREQYEFIYKVISLYATKLTGGALDSF